MEAVETQQRRRNIETNGGEVRRTMEKQCYSSFSSSGRGGGGGGEDGGVYFLIQTIVPLLDVTSKVVLAYYLNHAFHTFTLVFLALYPRAYHFLHHEMNTLP